MGFKNFSSLWKENFQFDYRGLLDELAVRVAIIFLIGMAVLGAASECCRMHDLNSAFVVLSIGGLAAGIVWFGIPWRHLLGNIVLRCVPVLVICSICYGVSYDSYYHSKDLVSAAIIPVLCGIGIAMTWCAIPSGTRAKETSGEKISK